MPKPPYDLKALKAAANAACERAAKCKGRFKGDGLIPWAYLFCLSAARFKDDEGVTDYCVWISCASPGAVRLRTFIEASLRNAGFPEVAVVLTM